MQKPDAMIVNNTKLWLYVCIVLLHNFPRIFICFFDLFIYSFPLNHFPFFCQIHTNPTFFYPATGKCVILDQNQWKELKNNDKISLLPNDLIFSVETDQEEDGIQETVSSKALVAELKSASSIIQEEVQINEKSNLEEKYGFSCFSVSKYVSLSKT